MRQFDNLAGKVIMFEGPDGVGKSKQIELACTAIQASGQQVFSTRVHGGTPMGEVLREVSFLPDERPPETDLYLSLAMHDLLAPVLQTHRQAGEANLVDRSPLSMWAYQVAGSGLDPDFARPLMERDLEKFHPELLIVYKASLQVIKARIEGQPKHKRDYFESKPDAYFERVINGYDETAQRYGATVIDATGSIEETHVKTMAVLAELI